MPLLIFFGSLNASARQEEPALQNGPEGSFRGEIETRGGAAVFGVNIRWHAGQATTTIRCGGETWQIAETSWDGNTLTLNMPEFDAKIEARRENSNRYVGTYQRVRSATSTASLPFRMIPPVPDPPGGPVAPFIGRWKLRFADSDSDSVAIFDGKGNGSVSGTIMTTTGDYRFLGGRVDATSRKLHLSAFDGGHVFCITASLDDDGKLSGDFWSGDWYHTPWNAEPAPDAKLLTGFGMSQIRVSQSLANFAFPDLNGSMRSLNDPDLLGQVTIVELFGSWCPNCHDAARFLGELAVQYGDSGLKIVGLAFELTGDETRDRIQVARYVERFQVKYPVLIAGLADKEKATESFPMLDRVRAYPTFLFVDSSGQIVATYTGFSGPATGDEYERLKQAFRKQIEMLLSK